MYNSTFNSGNLMMQIDRGTGQCTEASAQMAESVFE